jgi:hypothetical protein
MASTHKSHSRRTRGVRVGRERLSPAFVRQGDTSASDLYCGEEMRVRFVPGAGGEVAAGSDLARRIRLGPTRAVEVDPRDLHKKAQVSDLTPTHTQQRFMCIKENGGRSAGEASRRAVTPPQQWCVGMTGGGGEVPRITNCFIALQSSWEKGGESEKKTICERTPPASTALTKSAKDTESSSSGFGAPARGAMSCGCIVICVVWLCCAWVANCAQLCCGSCRACAVLWIVSWLCCGLCHDCAVLHWASPYSTVQYLSQSRLGLIFLYSSHLARRSQQRSRGAEEPRSRAAQRLDSSGRRPPPPPPPSPY